MYALGRTVKSEEKRDQNTLDIGAGLAIFVLIVVVGAIALSLVRPGRF